MSPPCRIEEAPGVWRVVNRAGEELRITLDEVLHDTSYALGVDPGLVKDGVEAHLQELLAASPGVLGDGFTLVRREYPTAIGPVDLLCRDASGASVAIEVKRRGEIDGVEQLTRCRDPHGREPLRPPRAGGAKGGGPIRGPHAVRRPGCQGPGRTAPTPPAARRWMLRLPVSIVERGRGRRARGRRRDRVVLCGGPRRRRWRRRRRHLD